MKREQGLVVGIFDYDLSTYLTADASVAATTLFVSDLAHFNPLGGMLALKAPGALEEDVAYTGIDTDAGTLTGVTPLVNAYTAADTTVSVYPYITVRYAEVRIDGQRDTVRSRVPLALWDRLSTGILSDSTGGGMRVEVELVGEFVVQDIIGTDPDSTAPDYTIGDLVIEDSITLVEGAVGTHEQGTTVTLEGQQSAPQSGPIITQDFEVVTAKVDPINALLGGADYTAYKASDRRGMFYDVANGFIYYCGVGTGDLLVRKVSDVSGSAGTTVVFDGAYEKGSVTKVGANFYVLARRKSTGNYYVRQYDSSFAFITDWNVGPAPSSSTVLLTTDGTDLWYTWTSSANKLGGSRVSTADPTLSLEIWFSGSGFSTTDQVRGCVPNGTYDYGDAVSRFAAIYNNDEIRHWNDSTGVYEGYAPSPVNQVAGMMYGSDGNWYVMGDGPDTGTTYSILYRLSALFWPFSSTSVHHAATTWHDSAGTTHETTTSPVTQATLERRKRVTVTVPEPIPSGGVDDPDSVRVYMAKKATAPTNSELWRQDTLAAGVTTYTRRTAIAASGSNPPSANDFPGGNAAVIESQEDGTDLDSQGLGTGWTLKGDGYAHGFSDWQTFTSSGTWNKPKVGGITTVEIVAIGGGGGGGSGMRNSGGNAAGGGGAGAGAAVVIARFPITALNATESVVVAGTAGGGAARTVNGQVGIDGTPGSDTTMTIGGTIKVRAKGGLGGTGGGASGGPWAGGNAQNGDSTFESYEGMGGGDGGTAAPVAGLSVPRILNNYYRQGAPGGGGGGGVQAGGAIASGAAGGSAFDLTGGAGGSTNGTAGTSKGTGLPFPGSGGGGGGGRTAGAAGDGGAGGAYGAGGGGGGGGQAQNSGAGGAGGAGIVVVRCY